MLKKMRIQSRIILIIVGIIALFGVMALSSNNISKKIRDLATRESAKVMLLDQKAKVQVATHATAIAISEAIRATGLEKQDAIVELIRKMVDPTRYEEDGSGYIFVYQGTVNVAFPVKPQSQGKDLGQVQDKNGVYVIRDLQKQAEAGGGFVEYIWAKPGAGDVAKVSYAEMIPGLDMWIGTGVYIDNIEKNNALLRTEVDRLTRSSSLAMMIGAGCIFLAIVALSFFIALGINSGLQELIANVRDVAEGEADLTKRIKVVSTDELGELGNLLNSFLQNLQEMITRLSGSASQVNASSKSLTSVSQEMFSRANDTATTAEKVTSGAESLTANLHAVAATMEQSSANSAMVATAAEKMTVTVQDIAGTAEQASSITSQAVEQTLAASERMEELGVAAAAISKVTEAINDISDQTNLLALNATIEAARAGESGKGFAVVANEIKELARQTAESTQHIKTQIEGMQSTTDVTVEEIRRISTVIQQVNDMVSSIAIAVEEQSSATSEIATNIAQASQGLLEVNENVGQSSMVAGQISADINKVSRSAGEITSSSNQVREQATQLQHMAQELQTIIGRFHV